MLRNQLVKIVFASLILLCVFQSCEQTTTFRSAGSIDQYVKNQGTASDGVADVETIPNPDSPPPPPPPPEPAEELENPQVSLLPYSMPGGVNGNRAPREEDSMEASDEN